MHNAYLQRIVETRARETTDDKDGDREMIPLSSKTNHMLQTTKTANMCKNLNEQICDRGRGHEDIGGVSFMRASNSTSTKSCTSSDSSSSSFDATETKSCDNQDSNQGRGSRLQRRLELLNHLSNFSSHTIGTEDAVANAASIDGKRQAPQKREKQSLTSQEVNSDSSQTVDHSTIDTEGAVAPCDSISAAPAPSKQKLRHRRKKEPPISIDQVPQIVDQFLRETSLAMEAWDEVAREYHIRIEPFTSLFIPHLLDNAYVEVAGRTVLDVATGTGSGALFAASMGASSVVATDFSMNMLSVLRGRIDSCPCDNLQVQNANGMCLPLSWSRGFDVTFSNFGVIYFGKVREGLSEMVRCTKLGGRVCISAWGSKEETHAFSVFPAALERCKLDRKWYQAQKSARKELLALSGRKKCRGESLVPNYFCPVTRISSGVKPLLEMMTEAGLGDVHVIPVSKKLQLDSTESYWNRFVLASPNLHRFVKHCLTPDEVEELKAAVSSIICDESSHLAADVSHGVELRASAYIAVGTKTCGGQEVV